MADRRCDSCGAERGPDGPCPGCGALPAVHLVVLEQEAPGEVRRATTDDAPQRKVALGVVLAVVALVAGSIVWDSVSSDADEAAAGADDDEEREEEEEDESSTTSTTRPQTTQPSATVSEPAADEGGDGPSIVAPVEGFEDRWLLTIAQGGGEVWQVPLGGGEVTPVIGRTNNSSHSMPPWFRLVGDALVSRHGAVSLVDGSRWSYNSSSPDGGWGYLAGVTDTSLVFAGEALTERTPAGELLSEWGDLGMGGLMGGYVSHIAGRRAIVSTQHGVYSLDLDTHDARLVLDGSYFVANDDVLVGLTCIGWQYCDVQVIEIDTGKVMANIENTDLFARSMDSPRNYIFEPVMSPDGERLILVVDGQLQLVNLNSGEHLGTFELPATRGGSGPSGGVQVVWAPDSSAVLVYARPGVFSGSLEDQILVRIDRDMLDSEPLGRLLDTMHEVTAVQSMALVLSDRPFEPVPEE